MVARHDGLRVGTPEKTLVDWLPTRACGRCPSRSTPAMSPSPGTLVAGNPLERLSVRDLHAPINIVGTLLGATPGSASPAKPAAEDEEED